MKTLKSLLIVLLIAAMVAGVLLLPAGAETVLDPARESGLAAAAGYDLDAMRAFKETLPDGTVKIWYLDESNGIEAFWQRMDHDEKLANIVAHCLAADGEYAYNPEIMDHPTIDGIKVATVAPSDGSMDLPRDYAGFSFIDDAKAAADPAYKRTVVTYQGNCNKDASLDMKDVLVLRLRIRDIGSGDSTVCTDPGYEGLAQALFDANGDGTIDMKDVLYLRKYIAGMIDFAAPTVCYLPDPPFAEYRFDLTEESDVWACPAMPTSSLPANLVPYTPEKPDVSEPTSEPETSEPTSEPETSEADPKFENPYGVFLGVTETIPASFSKYETLVIDAQYFTDKQIKSLKDAGHTVYSYLNVGSLEDFRDYYDQYKGLKLGDYTNWDEEIWIDVSNTGWQSFILDTLAEQLKAKGIDGYFVDNCDVYYEYPRTAIYNGLVTIMEGLVDKGIAVIINSGNDFVDKYVDKGGDWRDIITGINQETVFSGIDWETETFTTADPEDHAFFMEYVETYGKQGADIFLLEYTTDTDLIAEIDAYCAKHGFLYYASRTLELLA